MIRFKLQIDKISHKILQSFRLKTERYSNTINSWGFTTKSDYLLGPSPQGLYFKSHTSHALASTPGHP